MNERELDLALDRLGVEHVRRTAPSALRDRVHAVPLTTKRRSRLLPLGDRGPRPLFSATKLIVAGAIVALFGGFLLAGVLTAPDDEQVAPAAASPSPTASLVSALDMEEVRPGVFRVLGDGHRDLSTSVWDVAVSGTGDVWVDRLVDGTSRVSRLGSEHEYELSADVVPIGRRLSVDRDGSIRATPDRERPIEMTFDGEAWVPAEERMALGGGGTGDAVDGDGFWASAAWDAFEVVRETDDGLEPVHLDLHSADPEFRLTGGGGGVLVAPAGDGTVWVSLSTPGSRLFKLASFDGQSFDPVETGGPSGPSSAGLDVSGQNVLTAIAEAPDGRLWVSSWLRHADVLYVWSWDGVTWTAYDPVETMAGTAWSEVWAGDRSSTGAGPRTGTWFEPDGSIWFDGLVHFDGERFTSLDAPAGSTDATTRVGAISVAPDGTIWIVMVDGDYEDCEASPTCGLRSEGLYVITPGPVAGSE